MLCSLHIENIAVIKSADIDLHTGFTVLTGETGAGKSMIIDSINLILGAKPSRDCIRSGEDEATVTALFGELSKEALLRLDEQGISPDEEGYLLLSRKITVSGKSTVRLNGRVIPLSLLKSIAGTLVAIHGQHDNMTLLNPDSHLAYLDAYAKTSEEWEAYRQSYEQFCELNRKISDLSKNEREKAQRSEFLKFQIDEIEAAKLKSDEEEKLSRMRDKLQNSEKINQLSHLVYAALYQNEKGTSATDRIRRSVKALDTLAAIIPDAAKLSSRLETVVYEIEDIASTAEGFADDDEDPTAKLNRLEERLDEIAKLERKYGDTVPDVLAYLAKAKEEYAAIESSDERLAELYEEKKQLLLVMTSQAEELSEKRRTAALRLNEAVIAELAFLDMKGVSFSVAFGQNGEAEPVFTRQGTDRVEFLIATNKGEPLKPMARIASGGELSRIMLAVKSVLADRDSLSTMIFDEVDTGVSGKTSQKIGMKLRALAVGTVQVICVTHSAQIAAIADNHYLIAKHEQDGRVATGVTPLDLDGRVREVARIMGGITITDKLLDTAREMIVGRDSLIL